MHAAAADNTATTAAKDGLLVPIPQFYVESVTAPAFQHSPHFAQPSAPPTAAMTEKIAPLEPPADVGFCGLAEHNSQHSMGFRRFAPGIRIGCGWRMPRAPRIYVRDGIYHAMSRGNRKQIIFEDACDRSAFGRILTVAAEEYAVDVYSECLMGNHFHLVVRTPRANISEFMGYLNGEYAKYSNNRHQRIGHLFGDRFKSVLVDSGLYLRVLLSYVLNNPVASAAVGHAGEWEWSSYRAIMGRQPAPPYLCVDWLEEIFPASSLAESRALFEQYMNSSTVEDAEGMLAEVALGSDPFKARIRALIAARMYTESVPRSYRALHRPPLKQLMPRGLKKSERDTAILRAHSLYAYTLAELARYLGLHPASVSRIICSVRPRVD